MSIDTPNVHGPRGTERAQAQRERILNAAKKCFVEHGFHAASMAQIAETAEMSPGLIYRYFDSKKAIILAIIERQLQESRTNICASYAAPDFAAAVFNVFQQWRVANPCVMNPALFMEMSAEATRDPELAAALRKSDLVLRKELADWLAAGIAGGGKGLPAETAQLRAIGLQCFMEGLAIRAVREPDLSPEALKATIAHFLDALFSG